MDSSLEEKYNMLVHEISQSKQNPIPAKDFGLGEEEFSALVKEIERDGLFERGEWAILGGYIFLGLTYKGRSFIENNDSKMYHKIEKTEINYHNTLNIGGDNHGIAVSGSENTIINSEFEKKFTYLIEKIKTSSLLDKENIVMNLESNKHNTTSLRQTLGSILTRGAEVGSITGAIIGLLGLL